MANTCTIDHGDSLPTAFRTLPESQAGKWRHTCAGCAYELGRTEAKESVERLRERVRLLGAELTQLKAARGSAVSS
jgi:hypothetical protein